MASWIGNGTFTLYYTPRDAQAECDRLNANALEYDPPGERYTHKVEGQMYGNRCMFVIVAYDPNMKRLGLMKHVDWPADE